MNRVKQRLEQLIRVILTIAFEKAVFPRNCLLQISWRVRVFRPGTVADVSLVPHRVEELGEGDGDLVCFACVAILRSEVLYEWNFAGRIIVAEKVPVKGGCI